MVRFSAIVPNYNDSRHIGESLVSLRQQTRPFDEILIIDDGSTDDSREVIARLIADMPNARLVRNERNLGVVETINRGFALVDGDFVLMASANDTYSPRFLVLCEDALAMEPNAAMLCGNAVFSYANTHATKTFRIPLRQAMHFVPPSEVRSLLLSAPLTFFGGAVMLKRSAILAAHGLLAPLRWNSDWLLYHVVALRYGMVIIPEPLTTTTISSRSYSSAARQWKEQRSVIRCMLESLRTHFPQEMPIFRAAALLPTYDIRILPLIMGHRQLRYYYTPLLCWRLASSLLLNPVKHFFPHPIRQKARRILKV